jgi:DNA-binding transcriptional LysR family regulator
VQAIAALQEKLLARVCIATGVVVVGDLFETERSALCVGAERTLKALPIDLPGQPWPVTVATLRNRTLSPVVSRFIESAREVSKSATADVIKASTKLRS